MPPAPPPDPRSAPTGLSAQGIRLAYHPAHPVIENLSTTITPGAVTMIVGPNACGKSTLLRALSRVLSPGSGRVVLDGRDIATLSPKQVARRVGMLAQSSIAPPGITVHELVARGRYPHQSILHQWSARDDEAVSEAMERTDVSALATRRVASLSGGQRQRVWIAMALAQRTGVLLLDEPTTYLDLAHQVDVLELFHELNTDLGTTIVAVLHDLNQACRYGDEIIAMRAGAILAHGAPEDVITAELVEDVFGLPVEIIADPLTGTPLVLHRPRGTIGASADSDRDGPGSTWDGARTARRLKATAPEHHRARVMEDPMSTATPPLPTTMRGVVMHAPGDVRVEDREVPRVVEPTDAVLKIEVACICGSDLWPYRGIQPVDEARPMGHEYVGTVVEVGDDVKNIEVGDFVVGSFCISDNTCEICADGFQSRCANGGFMSDTQSQYTRVPQADGTLVVVPGGRPEDPEIMASLLAASDVLGTGWFGAVAAHAGPGRTIAVVGDGAVGLSAVLAAKALGSERVIAFSRHEDRARLAREFGADVVVAERGEEGAAKVKELTGGYGAHGVVEAVGNQVSMDQAIASCRPGGHVGYVGVAHGVSLNGQRLFFAEVSMLGGPAPVRRFLPDLIDRILKREIDPGKVFTLRLPLEEAAEGYKAMDERRAIKVLLEV